MATWWIWRQSYRSVLKNSRSPGRSWLTRTGIPALYWYRETRGSRIPTERYDANASPEQSYEFGPSAAHSYGLPCWRSAKLTADIATGAAWSPLMLVPSPRLAERLSS